MCRIVYFLDALLEELRQQLPRILRDMEVRAGVINHWRCGPIPEEKGGGYRKSMIIDWLDINVCQWRAYQYRGTMFDLQLALAGIYFYLSIQLGNPTGE